jgi:hypothetical protein
MKSGSGTAVKPNRAMLSENSTWPVSALFTLTESLLRTGITRESPHGGNGAQLKAAWSLRKETNVKKLNKSQGVVQTWWWPTDVKLIAQPPWYKMGKGHAGSLKGGRLRSKEK